jgi:hypothetical protein
MAVRLSVLRTSRTLLPRKIIIIFMFLVLISVRGWVNPKAWCGRKDHVNLKKINSSGLEPAIFRLVAQCPNHYTTVSLAAVSSLHIKMDVAASITTYSEEFVSRRALKCGLIASFPIFTHPLSNCHSTQCIVSYCIVKGGGSPSTQRSVRAGGILRYKRIVLGLRTCSTGQYFLWNQTALQGL